MCCRQNKNEENTTTKKMVNVRDGGQRTWETDDHNTGVGGLVKGPGKERTHKMLQTRQVMIELDKGNRTGRSGEAMGWGVR